jgi:5-methyltetrahydrofolate--homocysteine methyltransferase
MHATAAVSGSSHPQSHDLGVGWIEWEHARRKGWDLAMTERWLGPILNCEA